MTVDGAAQVPVQTFTPDLPEHLARARVRDRVTRDGGITLATAPVVISGGRGVGSADGFAMLEELAALLASRAGRLLDAGPTTLLHTAGWFAGLLVLAAIVWTRRVRVIRDGQYRKRGDAEGIVRRGPGGMPSWEAVPNTAAAGAAWGRAGRTLLG